MPVYYYVVIVVLGVGNLVLAVVAYFQRSKQIRGNRLREQQLLLAEARNDLAGLRLERLNDQLALLTEIRDAVCRERRSPHQALGEDVAARTNGHSAAHHVTPSFDR